MRGIRILRRLLPAVGWALLGAFSLAFTIYVAKARGMPDLEAWHAHPLPEDFQASDAGATLAEYLAREDRIFGVLEQAVRDRGPMDGSATFSRFNPHGVSNPANQPQNWNRTYEFEVAQPRGGVLLIHGLSDSPYSTRAVGELFREHGFHVLGLRMPGHGSIPGALTRATWRDWREAVRVGVRHLAGRIPAERPLVIVGYSNGAALAVDYTLGALGDRNDPRPTGLVFLSPAVGVTPIAALARLQRRLAVVPFFEKLAWTEIRPEYDPFKYNSFPVRAGEQIYQLTSRIGKRLGYLAGQGGLRDFPPVLAFQSVVDATIPPPAIVDRLLVHLPPGRSELVLFDVNRIALAEPFLDTDHEAFLRFVTEADELPFALTVVTNASGDTNEVVARTRPAATREWSESRLGLAWPRGVYSLSHVALPFRPDDPIYGAGEGRPAPGRLALGVLEPRGERGVLALPVDQLMRLRYNPFFDYVEARIAAQLSAW